MEHQLPAEPVFTMLLVCTGNICRSALAERLGRAFLTEALGDDAELIRVVSAGTRAVVGSEMHPDSALVLTGLGAEPGDFRARQLVAQFVEDADLTLTMTRRHRSEVLEIAPRALGRTFTLREAADLVRLLGDEARPAGTDLAERGRRLVQDMAAVRGRRRSDDGDDIPDPIGRPVEVHDEVGQAIADAWLPVLRHLAELRTADAGTAATREATVEVAAGATMEEEPDATVVTPSADRS